MEKTLNKYNFIRIGIVQLILLQIISFNSFGQSYNKNQNASYSKYLIPGSEGDYEIYLDSLGHFSLIIKSNNNTNAKDAKIYSTPFDNNNNNNNNNTINKGNFSTGQSLVALDTTEYLSLLAIYEQTNGPGWYNNNGWRDAKIDSIQKLPNVYYNSSGRVIKIKLEGNNLKGSLPSEIVNFPFLEELNLNNNKIGGTIADEITTLAFLKKLELGANQIEGKIPSSIGDMVSLEVLNLGSNNMSDSIPESLGDLHNLYYLSLMYNSFSGEIPDQIGNLSKLTDLALDNNNLTGSIPSSILNIDGLVAIGLSYNNLSGGIPEILFNAHIRQINLSNNNLSGGIPKEFGKAKNLSSILLHDNPLLGGEIPKEIENLSNIEILGFANCNLSGEIPNGISKLNKLRFLSLSENNLTGEILDSLQFLSVMEQMYLNGNNLSGIIPIGFAKRGTRFNVRDNNYSMSGILPMKQTIGFNLPAANYIPQNKIDEEKNIQTSINGSVTLTTQVDRNTTPASFYQWFKENGTIDIPLNSMSVSGHTFLLENVQLEDIGSKYYYKITNPDIPGFSLTSNIQTLIEGDCPTSNIDFYTFIYDCAVQLTPNAYSLLNYDIIDYQWEFGDGMSSKEKAPVHAYGEEGTFNVKLTINYSSDSCGLQTAVKQKLVSFNESEAQNYKDSTIYVITHQMPKVLASSASTFSDAWSLPAINASLESKNEFENGTKGVWRNEGSHVYNVNRQQSSAIKLKQDGTFQQDQFNWGQADWEAIPNWIRANTITNYNGQGYEVENKDVLGIYTSALYDYEGHLPTANGLNMRQEEMAFTSFETIDANTSGNWMLGNQATSGQEVLSVVGSSNSVFVNAPLSTFSNVTHVSLKSQYFNDNFPNFGMTTVHYRNDTIICRSAIDDKPEESTIVLKKAPPGLWVGRLTINRPAQGSSKANIDFTFAHSGKASMKVDAIGGSQGNGTETSIYRQELLQLDSGKSYMLSAWVSEKVFNSPTPFLSNGIGIEVVLKDRNNTLRGSYFIQPHGQIIEGWQQLKGTFTVPGNYIKAELSFKKGQANAVWYDDLRLHPERGNMKTYVYNTEDYRLQAVLDEENYASYYYYDKEGNLFLVKKETEEGIKTLSESITHQKTGN